MPTHLFAAAARASLQPPSPMAAAIARVEGPTGAFTALTGNPWHLVDVDALRYVPLNLLLVIVVAAVVVALGASLPGLRARDRRRAARAASRALLAGSVIAILAVTLASSTLSSGTNLVPLRGIAGQLANLNGEIGALNILGNAVMFLPVGLLAPMALGWGIGRVTAAACALSVAIEIVQLALGRSADVDDVILNTVGAALGAAIAVAIAIFYRRAADRRPAPSDGRRAGSGASEQLAVAVDVRSTPMGRERLGRRPERRQVR